MSHGEFFDDSAREERRQDSRTTAVYRPVLMETEDFTGFCLLKNLSARGMMGMAYAHFATDEKVNVHFMPGHIVSGRIVWSEGGKVGIEFDHEIDLADSLAGMSGTYVDARINRAPRLQIECDGQAVIGGQTIRIRVQDISQRGIKAIIPSIRPGEEVLLRLPGMEPRKAVVRWSQFDTAGLNFLRPIAFEELARWAIERQSETDEERIYG